MSSIPKQTLCGVIPCLRYRDAPAAIVWLRDTLGFDVQFVVPNEAQLTFGNSMIMLGSAFDSAYGQLLKQPAETGGYVTQSAYLVVNDADHVYGRVLETGGRILLDIKDEDYGGRGFTCSDPEGHVWSIGTYDPYAD
jgi:uncharacterized glyoxalase superfamily protein PhnB